jgi:hypothetical protein
MLKAKPASTVPHAAPRAHLALRSQARCEFGCAHTFGQRLQRSVLWSSCG